ARTTTGWSRSPSGCRWPIKAVVSAMGLVLMGEPVAAQSFADVGTRAQGMAGAFIAVADDATATWWNPAGLAGGALFSAVFERGTSRMPDEMPPSGPAMRTRTSGLALGYPALGLSVYRFRVSERGQFQSIAAVEPDRQDQGLAPAVRALAVSAFGATFGQSIGNHIVVATTVRLLRAEAVTSSDVSGTDALDRVEDLSGDKDWAGDLDLGLMLRFGPLSVGGAVKHLGEPGFGDERERITLTRQARAGAAIRKEKAGVFDSLVGAIDLDLTTNPTVFGDERRVAAGGELGVLGSRLVARGGLSRNIVGSSRGTWQGSAGASIALRSGVYVDGAITPGDESRIASRTGWSLALRTIF
ncbi:MAG: hypothetical protein AB7N65_23600, partial [Vicinamibacterales bacterium]